MEGRPIHVGPAYPPVGGSTMDPRNAMASALRAYLSGLVFLRSGLGSEPDQRFKLDRVLDNWPQPQNTDMDYPTASVVDTVDAMFDSHNLVPTMLEETLDVFGPQTVLWKTAECTTEFQVDFWTDGEPVREAIMARLPQAFAPGEGRYGVVVEGSQRYYDRPVRLTLIQCRRMDDAVSSYDRQWRATARVAAQVDAVHLRQVRELDAHIGIDVVSRECEL